MTEALPETQISFVECSRFMALALGRGEEGSVKAAGGAAERSEQSGEPLQVPTASGKTPPEAGARDERRNFGTLSVSRRNCSAVELL